MTRPFRNVCVATACLVTFCLAGCGGGAPADMPELVPVKGTVTQDGKPLAGAIVTFEPSKGAPSSGATNDAGEFELRYNIDNMGAVPGTHTVRISKSEGEAGAELLPAKFNTESDITKEVASPGPNDIKIDL